MPRLPAQTYAFHVMAKPTGSRCNLSCDYCFFTKKHYLYPQSSFVMPDNVMQAYIRQTIQAHSSPSVTFAWQGGEPTLMGLDFYRRTLELIKENLPAGMEAENTLQTNGVLLDEEWCRFLHDNNFLVGISIDGPRRLHDIYRKDKAGNSVFDRVIDSVRLMQKHQVEFNVLCTVNAQNSQYPLEVYRFFRDQLKAPYLQFIPIVERDNVLGNQQGSQLTDRTVKPEQYGRFLIDIFDEWVRGDVGEMFVLTFEAVLMSYLRGYSSLCVLSPRCGENVTLEHNGDVYSCDHYVEPDYLLGNILQTPLKELILSKQQTAFGETKSSGLPSYCKQCLFLFTCYGECPKNRVLQTPDGEEGLNWLCTGLKAFFAHSKKPMQIMAALLRLGQPATDVMEIMSEPEWNVPSK